MAGKVQLLTSGPQDAFFTTDPDYTHFLEKFRKHSNFSNQYVDIKPDTEVEFGNTVRFKIPQNQGDLLKTLSVKMTLPEIATSATIYIESVAHALIERVDLLIGGKLIQSLTSDYLQIYTEHNITQTKQAALEQLIGKYPLRTSDRKVSEVIEGGSGNAGIIINGSLGADTDEKFIVDLPFYFHGHPELAIPLCAIKHQEVEVEFKLRSAQDLVIGTDGRYKNFQEDLKIKEFILCTDVVFLDVCERFEIANTPRDYLITQLQQNSFDFAAGVNEGKCRLEFINPVKELYFVIQRRGTTGNGIDRDNFVTPFDYDNIYELQDNKLILYENLNYLELTLDGEDVIKREFGSVVFLKAVQAAIHHSKTQLIRRFYSYSFALQPEEWYPTGQVNFSMIKEQILNLSMTPCPEFARQIRVYATSYNTLRISQGTAQTLFE